MEKDIKLIFSINDKKLLNECKDEFGDELKLCKESDLSGFEILFVAIIPSIGITIQLVDFIIRCFSKKAVDNTNNEVDDINKAIDNSDDNVVKQRRVEIDGHRISLINYSPEEVVFILNKLFKNNSDDW